MRNDIPFIKNSFGEDDYLKVNNIKNNILQKNDQNSTQDLSLTVHMDENENNIIMNEKEIKEIKKNFFKLKKIGNLIIISEDEKEIKYVIGPLFPLLCIQMLLLATKHNFFYLAVYTFLRTHSFL